MGRNSGCRHVQPECQALKGFAGSTLVSGFDEFRAFAGLNGDGANANAARFFARRCCRGPGLGYQG